MTSLWSRLGLALALAGLTQVGAAAILSAERAPPSKPVTAAPVVPIVPITQAVQVAQANVPAAPRPPAQLSKRIEALGRQFNGKVGIAVKSVDDGWTAAWMPQRLYPQQSVSKLWVAITALDAVDKGRLNLDDRVTLTKSDLTLFHQPIRSKVLGNGGHTTTLEELLHDALTKSDNTANDKLMRAVGGPDAVRSMIKAKQLGTIRFYDGERSLQSKIAGLTWSQSYSIGRAFYEARNALPMTIRRAAFNRYLEDPYDGATASAIVDALARLKKGELLSPSSTARILTFMGNARTGPNRLKGGLEPGWTVAHKTGTGQVLGAVQAGYNDIGVVVAPDGRSYAVAVMIKETTTPLPTRMALMNNVVRAIIQQHNMSRGTAYAL
ncbi:MAG TPA: class A beta-lactamase [Sphingomicrobium sp.]|nr:class A beta-lactamase [Sphingomicrobium sp.]